MKQFVTQNLFIVIMVGVVVLALVGCIFPMIEVGHARTHGEAMRDQDTKVQGALQPKNFESPRWVDESIQGISEIKKIQEDVIEKALKTSTREPLLVKGRLIFPDPALAEDEVSLFNFQQFYGNSLAERGEWLKAMEAGWQPTKEDVAAEIERIHKTYEGNVSEPQLKEMLDKAPTDLLARRSQEIRLWAHPGVFDNYIRKLGDTRVMSHEQLWEALLNWWVQNDIVKAIASANREPTGGKAPRNVTESPVKELVYIQVGNYLLPAKAGTTAQATLTGRVSNERYDVLLYRFQVVMDPSHLPQLAGQLSRKNFHTVLSVRCDPADRKGGGRESGSTAAPAAAPMGPPAPAGPTGPAGPTAATFEYGSDSVMAVTLQCEAIFMKSPASWRGAEAQKKRLDFLTRGENRKLVLEVHKISPTGERRIVLKNNDLMADRDKPEGGRLEEWMLRARLKIEAGKDIKDPAKESARLIAQMGNLLKNDDRYAKINHLAAEPAELQDLAVNDLQFIFLYEDLMPKEIRDKNPGLMTPVGPTKVGH